ncbi:hypothetical protein RFI_33111 [Reticulomyxa filosa]|uniref:Uncharacterized protein n=1 Tax=Reticulomyxa filosa TaxID=46433 RepID=X6LT50_RETFI|nr:hypothetical protein RFI_33111 [Reticulomyxa filosa]|eukprot:ETO04287.1 hypothetical protein RFI_33111 [Reticulomyxa filosa]
MASFRVRFVEDFATVRNIRDLVSLSTRIIHYSGFGLPHALALESEEQLGMAKKLPAKELRDLIAIGGGSSGLELVFVSAYHSLASAKAFMDAGVKHVVCMTQDNKTAIDNTSKNFIYQFYLHLVQGETIQAAFDKSKEIITTTTTGNSGSVNKSSENTKFRLLPEDKSHDVVLFANATAINTDSNSKTNIDEKNKICMLKDCSRKPSLRLFFHPPDPWIGRYRDMFQLIKCIQDPQTRFTIIFGDKGFYKYFFPTL